MLEFAWTTCGFRVSFIIFEFSLAQVQLAPSNFDMALNYLHKKLTAVPKQVLGFADKLVYFDLTSKRLVCKLGTVI